MSRKPSFANLRGDASIPAALDTSESVAGALNNQGDAATRPASRKGRKQIAGFFTFEMSLALHMLALRQGRSLQTLMAEAFNDVLRKHGESPIGE